MNFDLSNEQRMIRDAVAAFVRDESPVSRFRRLRDTELGWEREVWRRMGDYGWLAIALPESYGGIGGTFVDLALVLEQLGRGLVPEPVVPSVVLAGSLIERRGTERQKSELLPPLAEGRISLALAYAERQSRYQLEDCLTRAEESNDGFRLRGEKVWVLNGHAADWIVVAARTAGDQLDAEGLSLFLVPGDARGLARTPVRGMDGQRSAFLRFDDVALPADALLGEASDALSDLEWTIDRGAAAACAEGQGLLRELLDRTVEYLRQREQFGVKIGSFQALQHRAADMFAEVELSQGTTILAAIQADALDPAQRRADISAAKVQLQDGGWFVQSHSIQLHGGVGVTDEQDIGLFFKRLRVLQSLYGDADFHVARQAAAHAFAGED
jgi:alkylation response protein AidB-like acyl-CoA dehydrogenase